MATEEKVVLVQDVRTLSRVETAKELKQLRQNPPDKAKRPGGYYLNVESGTAHDADGNEIDVDPGDKAKIKELRAMRGLPDIDSKPDPKSGTEASAEAKAARGAEQERADAAATRSGSAVKRKRKS
jgi:hypothetical protein